MSVELVKQYIITIKADNRSYTYGRFYDIYDVNTAMDTLEALFHLKLIDEFNIKEVTGNGANIDKAADVH